ncbi:MAG: hypothetical protein EOM26_10405 [Alphaproteobacteria bacterium]|nr:hypothetical protein [Alphaproteobacteria bacterium]
MKADHTRKSSLKRVAKVTVPPTLPALPDPRRFDLEDDACLDSLVARAADVDPADRAIAFHSDEDVLAWCVALVQESPTGSALLSSARKDGWRFEIADLASGGFHLDVSDRRCSIDHHSLTPLALSRSAYFRNSVLMSFARALRDIWHESRLGAIERDFGPEHVLMLERARAADGDTIAVFIGWELRGAGHADVWRTIIGSEEGDVAMIFSRFLERDPAALFDGSALCYAFRQWYADETRVNSCDHEALETIDEMIEDSENGRPFGDRRLTGDVLEELSAMPDGRNYLRGMGSGILCDPFFAGLKDPVNQAHLLHIVYDLKVVRVGNVPFRDEELARKIFPENETVSSEVR